jgi:hypothetical protein
MESFWDVDMDPPVNKAAYYGVIDTIGSRENPASIIRRTRGEDDFPVDEALHRDLEWHPTEYLYRYCMLGENYQDVVELTEEEVLTVISRWRRKWAARDNLKTEPTRTEVQILLIGLLDETVTRELATEWAAPWVTENASDIRDEVTWEGMCMLALADSTTPKGNYMYGQKNFQDWLGEFDALSAE